MHIDLLAVAPVAVQNCCDNNELLLCDKVADASLVLGCVVRRDRVQVEFQGGDERRDDSDQQRKKAQYPIHGGGVHSGELVVDVVLIQISRGRHLPS